jgi:hypothetical protein
MIDIAFAFADTVFVQILDRNGTERAAVGQIENK